MTDPAITPPASTSGPGLAASERQRLHKAAQAFEAIFVRQMLTSARSGGFDKDLWGQDQGHETWAAMRDERFADIAAQSGVLGLAKQIEAQIAARPGVVSPAPASPSAPASAQTAKPGNPAA